MRDENSKKNVLSAIKKVLLVAPISSFFLFTTAATRNYYLQEKLIFRAETLPKEHLYSWDLPHEELFLRLKNGDSINALFFKKSCSKGVVLFFHGRGKNLAYWGQRAKVFLDLDYDFFIIDYRGFGKSSPGLKEASLLEDGLTAYQYLKNFYEESAITIYGQSLGTSVATYVASKNQPKTLILEAPFYSMIAAASYTKPYMPEWFLRLMLRYPLEIHRWIKEVSAPIYIFHGTNDKVIPFAHSMRLYEEIKEAKKVEFIPLYGCCHHYISEHALYKSRLAEIL